MKIVEAIKRADRILLEMHLGMVCFGVVCQLAGAFFARQQGWYAASLWLGIAFAVAASIHMARTLDRALQAGETAAKLIRRGYLIRYAAIVLALALAALTGRLNPLVMFLGYLSLKVTAYLQPLTHRVLNRLFHETDPVPAQEAEDLPGEQAAADADSLTKHEKEVRV